MAWVAQFQWIPDKTPPSERLEMRCNLNKIKVGEEVSLIYDMYLILAFLRNFCRQNGTRTTHFLKLGE